MVAIPATKAKVDAPKAKADASKAKVDAVKPPRRGPGLAARSYLVL